MSNEMNDRVRISVELDLPASDPRVNKSRIECVVCKDDKYQAHRTCNRRDHDGVWYCTRPENHHPPCHAHSGTGLLTVWR